MDKIIPFNIPYSHFKIDEIHRNLSNSLKFCGDGPYTKEISSIVENHFKTKKFLLTTSCTHSLEMAALLCSIQPGDEIIMPSFTFVSTANAFVLRGAKLVFVDVRPDTMNIDESLIEEAITKMTKAIVPVHYAGVACEMDTINEIAARHELFVIEDAAQGVMSKYKERYLGTLGHLGCYSFHETKNYHCGEGGGLLINDKRFIERAEVIREKGTNRSRFLRGQIDKYTWVDVGSSYLLSDLNAAFLHQQIIEREIINNKRISVWNYYFENLSPLKKTGRIDLPYIPDFCSHNAHMFYIKFNDLNDRTQAIEALKAKGISTAFHYIPLHSSEMGVKHGHFFKNDRFTTIESERLLRLPMYFDLSIENAQKVIEAIHEYV